MFSILIVDDEWTIREGLKSTVLWKEWGIKSLEQLRIEMKP